MITFTQGAVHSACSEILANTALHSWLCAFQRIYIAIMKVLRMKSVLKQTFKQCFDSFKTVEAGMIETPGATV